MSLKSPTEAAVFLPEILGPGAGALDIGFFVGALVNLLSNRANSTARLCIGICDNL